jgi:hypothetical protein
VAVTLINNSVSTSAAGVGINAKFYDESGNASNNLPDQVQRIYNSEYGMKISYTGGKNILRRRNGSRNLFHVLQKNQCIMH